MSDLPGLDQDHQVDFPPATDEAELPKLRPIPLGELEAPDAAGPEWMNLNPIVNAVADAQEVEVGSRLWRDCGMEPYSGSSGQQNSYGWSFLHRLSPNYRRGVIANYGHRRAYYRSGPFRQFGYDQAGRPHGWYPESPGDTPKGPVAYETSRGQVIVSGPDAEHFWLTPLFALIDDPNPMEVETGEFGRLPSNLVARWMATLLVSSAVGTVRDRSGNGVTPYPWIFGDRAMGRLLHTMVEGVRRGLMMPEDIPTAAQWIGSVFLPFYGSAPGLDDFGLARPGRYPVSMFNGFFWLVPVCYDAMTAFAANPSTGDLAERFKAILKRWAGWAVDMNSVRPHDWFGSYKLHLDEKFAEGADGLPVESLLPFFEAKDFEFGRSDFSPWSFRCVDICADISGDNGLRRTRNLLAERFLGNAAQRKWLVGADGSYV